MDASISQEQMKRINLKVETGLYQSSDEVIEKALELLDEYDEELLEVSQKVQAGIEQLDNGQYTDYTDETIQDLFDRVKRRGRERRAARNISNND